ALRDLREGPRPAPVVGLEQLAEAGHDGGVNGRVVLVVGVREDRVAEREPCDRLRTRGRNPDGDRAGELVTGNDTAIPAAAIDLGETPGDDGVRVERLGGGLVADTRRVVGR